MNILILILPVSLVVISFVVLVLYVNRCVRRTVEPLAQKVVALTERVSDLEDERDDWKNKHKALEKLYENLQRLYDQLQIKYQTLLQWANGLARIIADMEIDYPPPPSEVANHNGSKFRL